MTTPTTNDSKTKPKAKTVRIPPNADEKIKQLRARATEIEGALRERKRKADTRRKVQLGGWLLAAVKKNPAAVAEALDRICEATGMEPPEGFTG